MGARVLVPDGRSGDSARPPTFRASLLLTLAGLLLLLVGLLDLALIWIPARLGNGEWEFATVSATMDSLPLATVGTALLAVGLVGSDRTIPTKLLGWGCVLAVAGLVVAAVLFGLDATVALSTSNDQARSLATRAVLKTSFSLVAYLAGYTAIAWVLLRRK